MNRNSVKKFIRPAIAAGIVLVFVAATRGFFRGMNPSEVCGTLSDCFFVAGVLLAGVAGIGWINNSGGYDMLGFGVVYVFKRFSWNKKIDDRPESYYDYKQRKAKDRKAWEPHSLLVGIACLVLGGLFLILYSNL